MRPLSTKQYAAGRDTHATGRRRQREQQTPGLVGRLWGVPRPLLFLWTAHGVWDVSNMVLGSPARIHVTV